MTRDGAISVNLVTGEASRASERPPEQDYSPSDDSAAFVHSAAERLDDRRIHKSEKKKRRNRRRAYREGKAAADRPSSRLQFSEEERAAPELQKSIRKSDKAADRLDAAKAAIPKNALWARSAFLTRTPERAVRSWCSVRQISRRPSTSPQTRWRGLCGRLAMPPTPRCMRRSRRMSAWRPDT